MALRSKVKQARSVGQPIVVRGGASAAKAARAWSGAAGALADEFNRQADQTALREGALAGKEGGVPDFEKDETLRERAYNDAALTTFANNMDMKSRTAINELSVKHAADPKGYLEATESYRQGMEEELKGVAPWLVEPMTSQFNLLSHSEQLKINQRHDALLLDKQKAISVNLANELDKDMRNNGAAMFSPDAEQSTTAFAKLGFYTERLDTILAQKNHDGTDMFSEVEKAKSRIKLKDAAFGAAMRSWIDAQPNAADALEAIRAGDIEITVAADDEQGNPTTIKINPKDEMSGNAWDQAIADAGARLTLDNKENAARVREGSRARANLEIALGDGSAGQAQINQADDAGLFENNEPARVKMQNVLKRRLAKGNADAVAIEAVVAAVDGGPPLSPKNKHHEKAADTHWQSVKTALITTNKDVPPEIQTALINSALVSTVAKTGIVPKSEIQASVGKLRAGSTEDRIASADQIERLSALAGNPLKDKISRSDMALAVKINDFISAGREPDDAVASAIEATSLTNKPALEAREQELKDGKTASNYKEWVVDHFDPGASLNILTGFGLFEDAEFVNGDDAAATADFKATFEDWFRRLGNEDKAKELAFKDLDRVYAVTFVDGSPRVMKYAPEAFYGHGGGDEEWIKIQLDDDIRDIGAVDKEVILGSDDRTSREATGGRPSYPILVKDENGAFTPLLKDNMTIRFTPDVSMAKSAKAKKAVRAAEEARDQANQSQDVFREAQRKRLDKLEEGLKLRGAK